MLVAGMLIVIVGVHELKDAVDRPRPAGGLVVPAGSSFPSAHAAYSTFYVWLAVTIVMRLRVGMARGALVVAAGIAIAALVGLSPRLPRRPLHERRQRRLGARAPPPSPSAPPWRWSSPRSTEWRADAVVHVVAAAGPAEDRE